MKDNKRKGDTVNPFNKDESWDLLCQFLSDDWVSPTENKFMLRTEEDAAKAWLEKVGGVALGVDFG